MSVELLNIDCMEYMKGLPDKAFDLAIVDPPYGIDYKHFNRPNKTPGLAAADKKIYYAAPDLDIIPGQRYFSQLARVSKNQIVWGGNYFLEFLNSTSCFIVWDKLNDNTGFADCEIAWTSFETAVRKFTFRWNGMLQGNMSRKQEKIHPTEKPYQLYQWCLKKYANQGDRILDTHGGSFSSAIAAHKLGFDFVGCEIDKDYYDAAVKRYKKETSLPLFDNLP